MDGLKYGECQLGNIWTFQLEDIWRWVCWVQLYGHASYKINCIEKSKKPGFP
jgi:hypothetical protein